MKKFFIITLIIVAVVSGIIIFFNSSSEKQRTSQISQSENSTSSANQTVLLINNHKISAEVADNQAEQARGLSNRDSLAPDAGMLFVFEQPGRPGFWMKDMLFNLDIIWIDGAKKLSI